MSYYLNILKDNPLGFWPLDEVHPSASANDVSGCGNHGTYTGTFTSNIMPLVYGGSFATKINNESYVVFPTNNNFYKNAGYGGFATSNYSDNDFSLEIWFKSNISSDTLVPIIADVTNSIGLFYKNGNLIFSIGSESLWYKLSFSEKAMHIVAKYNITNLEIYADGALVASKNIESFKFTNSSVSFQSGPTLNAGDSFLIDAPAIYRYGLSDVQIYRHFYAGLDHTQPIHIVYPDDGILLGLHGQNIAPIFIYEYSKDIQWQSFINDDTYYDEDKKYITFKKTDTVESKTFIIEDVFNVPSEAPISSSKVEWKGDKGITVEASINGSSWVSCTNNSALPQFFNKDSNITSNIIYIKITMTSPDTSKDFPRLSLFKISFYSKKESYAHNYGYYAESEGEYDLANFSYPVLIRHPNVGLKTKGTGGFNIDIDRSIQSVELMFTPSNYLSTTMFYSASATGSPETVFGWLGSAMLKTNIAKIFINGVDKTSMSNISDHLVLGEPHHIVLVFTAPITNTLWFNHSPSMPLGSVANYQNIGLYRYQLSDDQILNHYNLYCGKPAVSASDSSLTLTETEVSTYNQDYLIVSSA